MVLHFWKPNANMSIDEIEQNINELLETTIYPKRNTTINKITSASLQQFLVDLGARQKEYKNAMISTSTSDKEDIRAQYQRFYDTLKTTLKRPKQTNMACRNYMDLSYFHPVGNIQYTQPSQSEKNIAYSILAGNVATIIAGIISTPFCFVAGISLIIAGIIGTFAVGSYILGSKNPLIEPLKDKERELFQQGAKIMDPSLDFEQANISRMIHQPPMTDQKDYKVTQFA